jgi:hypothetical protein|tara:strand:+ start:5799 stop:10613 length:4815 start_codon:yes stop_codon:yes gene_type:complete
MSGILSTRKYLAITISLLFLCVPILNFIDTSEQIDFIEYGDSSLVSKNVLGINSPGSERSNVFSNSIFELNSGSPSLVLDNGSVVSFVNGTPVFTEGEVISISGQCSLLVNYSLYCSGLNNYGQLGLGNQQLLSGYVDFNGKITAALSQGNSHFCAILDDGSVSCWGRNNKGQLGDGTNTNQNSPTSVDLGINKTAVSISSGLDFTCALLNTGEVSCWGDNSFGVFANGATSNSNVPVIVNHSIGERVVSISTPGYSVCAISSTGSISCWGYSYTISSPNGELTNGSVSLSLPSGRSAVSLDGTNSHACAILDNGSISCWGVNTYGQVGNGECSSVIPSSGCSGSNTNIPQNLDTSSINFTGNMIAVSSGLESTCSISDVYQIYCWGNQNREFDNTTNSTHSPLLMNFASGSEISFSDMDMDGDGIFNILDVHMLGDDDGDGVPASNDPYPNNPARWMNCDLGSWGRISCTESSLGHYSNLNSLYQSECQLGEYQHQLGKSYCNEASSGHYVDSLASPSQSICELGYYQINISSSSCTRSDSGNFVSNITGDAGDSSTNFNNLSSTSASYTARISSQYDVYDYYKINLKKSYGLSINVESSNAEIDISLYNSSLGVIDYSNNLGSNESVNTNGTSSSSARNIYIVVERINSTGIYYMNLSYFNVDDSLLSGDLFNSIDAEISVNQILCSIGTYQPNEASNSCINAGQGHFVANSGASTQTPCSPGSYQGLTGESSCLTTSPGYYSSSFASFIQTPASLGHYVNTTGATSQQTCLAGTYQNQTAQTSCIDTNAGYYTSSAGSPEQIPCSNGSYQPSTAETSCILASPGNYVSMSASTNQMQCTPGNYQPYTGQSSCIDASQGNYSSIPESTSQIPCESGSYQPYTGQFRCLPASSGHYVPTNGSASQTPCALGTYQPLESSMTCLDADIGHYVDVSGSSSQFPCNLGTYNPNSGSNSSNDCLTADEGYYVSSVGSFEQSICSLGTYQPNTGQSSCIYADSGYFVHIYGSFTQYPCEAGSYQPQTAQSGCYGADSGHYVSSNASNQQTPCLVGTYNPSMSSTSSESCISADPGYFVQSEGSSSQDICLEGTYQPSEGSESCIDSPEGTFVLNAGQPEYIECSAGTYQPDKMQTSCIITEEGYFTDIPKSIVQIPCQAGTYQPSAGMASCLDADIGYYVSDEGQLSQQLNPFDFYTDSPASTFLWACPVNHITIIQGATSVDDCIIDTDGDRIIDVDDLDDDGDGRLDSVDDCSPGLTGWISNSSTDIDGDGCQDVGEDTDDDGDLILDQYDAFPRDSTESIDTDSDGLGDNADQDDDGDGWLDSMELICETDPYYSQSIPLDTDLDLECDLIDIDDDGDGYSDNLDWNSLDATEWVDTDGDGIGNNADTDDDGDGWSDSKEILSGTNPLLADTDKDGYIDSEDVFPIDISEWLDSDGDGTGDQSDSHPDFKYFQTNLQFVLAIFGGILTLTVFGYLGVIALRRGKVELDEIIEENKPVIEVDYPHEGMVFENDVSKSSIGEQIESEDEEIVVEEERDTSHIDALLNELPTPPKPNAILPPEGTSVNEYGQKVWADETGQVWCQNLDGSILRHDAATGGWIQYHSEF